VQWRKLKNIRPFIDKRVSLTSPENVTETLQAALPTSDRLEGVIVRLTVDYPREWDTLIDEASLRRHAASAFEFHLIRHPKMEARLRLPADQAVSSLTPLDLLDKYWSASGVTEEDEVNALQKMAKEIIEEE
jgi:DNA repair protein SbcD/Mre11